MLSNAPIRLLYSPRDVVNCWWMEVNGRCENNFNKQTRWWHNRKLIQTPDKCRPRPAPPPRWCEGVKFVPVSPAGLVLAGASCCGPPGRATIVQSISQHCYIQPRTLPLVTRDWSYKHYKQHGWCVDETKLETLGYGCYKNNRAPEL